MCGIAGYIGLTEDQKLLETMNQAQAHRGPDDKGYFKDDRTGFAFLRLAFIDVKHGQQPMVSSDGRYTIIYNGEIYNYIELRQELEALGKKFKTNSDTEVILEAYSAWGKDSFDKFNGMFAFALYDKKLKKLVLARDHFGIKPLYFTNLGTKTKPKLLFASEIKTLLATKLIEAKPNDKQIYRYLKFRIHEDNQETFFKDIYKLLPGEMMTIGSKGIKRQFFSNLPNELASTKPTLAYKKSEIAHYKQMLEQSIQMRLISEVPVGTCLSGGMDSSTIALTINKLIKDDSNQAKSVGSRQNTFSAVFPGSVNDEERFIDKVLQKAGGKVKAHKIYPSVESFKRDMVDFVKTQEEPTISTGPYAQYKVMEEASKHVKALLDGQGADEMMAGYYPYYFVYFRQLKNQKRYGRLVWEMLCSSDAILRLVRFRLYDKLKFRKSLSVNSLLNQQFAHKHRSQKFTVVRDDLRQRFVEDLFKNSIPALLRYEDKNTMRFSVEGRVPFLDKEVLKYLFSLDDKAIIKNGWNKRILRDSTKGLLPNEIRKRRNKVGFTTPEHDWFKQLKTSFYQIFLSQSFASRPYFNQIEVLNTYEKFLSNRLSSDTMMFWRLINIELWLRQFVDKLEADRTLKADIEPNRTKKLDIKVGAQTYRRYPLQTEKVSAQSSLEQLVSNRVKDFFKTLNSAPATHKNYQQNDWYLFISEKIVAITQGRSYYIWDIEPRLSARILSRFVVKSPYGIGLSSPWTMELAVREAGLSRLIIASIGGLLGKLIGKRGWFYILAGSDVRAIDGPTDYSVYPSNVSAKLPPKQPDTVAEQLTDKIKQVVPADIAKNFKGVVIMDANDIGRNTLGQNSDLSADQAEAIFADNPLGQGDEQTPLAVVFKSSEHNF